MNEDIREDATETYEAPKVVEIGSVHELTLTPKFFRLDDGFTLQGASIGQSN